MTFKTYLRESNLLVLIRPLRWLGLIIPAAALSAFIGPFGAMAAIAVLCVIGWVCRG